MPVLGTFADLDQVIQDFHERGTPIRRLRGDAERAGAGGATRTCCIARARRLGLPLVRVTSLGEGMRDAELAPLEIEDLLLRPTVQIDRKRLENFIRGKRVLVTGGGGSIGSEICTRVVAFGASDLLILESSEPSLHHILENPTLLSSDTNVDGVIADVRDRERVREVMSAFRPDVVFHAAALKHVPYLEKNWTEGIKTNVFGSVNVADAAVEAGADTIVMISTDKAIDPVSMLGATKRFAEMYGQALDAEFMGRNGATRIIAVRFGNVLGSVGSVVPKFKAQIARGGPITVTHPDMVRYFMTTREAADLVLTSASHADGEPRRDGADQRRRARLGLCAEDGPAGAHLRARRAHDPARRLRARRGHRDRGHRARAPASACTRSSSPARSRAPRSASTASWPPSPSSPTATGSTGGSQVLDLAIARGRPARWRNGRSRRRSRSSSAGSRCPSLPRQRRKRVSRRTDRLPAEILQGLRARDERSCQPLIGFRLSGERGRPLQDEGRNRNQPRPAAEPVAQSRDDLRDRASAPDRRR